jgi:inhibitor of cysteine peptidase
MTTVELTQSSLGASHELFVGDEVIIRLPENPTTGFRWSASLSSEGTLASGGDSFVPATGVLTPGAAGERVLRFVAAHPGSALITLTHGRAWEAGNKQSSQVHLIVR